MKISIEDAEKLSNETFQNLGYNSQDLAIITHHLIDSEPRGYGVAGLARIPSISDRLNGRPA